MSCKNTAKSMVLSLIVFFGLFVIISNTCYAQYFSSFWGEYPSYQFGGPGLYSLFGMYGGLGAQMISYSLIEGSGKIYSSLPGSGMISEVGIMSPFLIMGGLAPTYGNFGGLEIMGELRNFGRLNPGRVGNSPGLVSLGESGSLAGLVSLGSNAGLIYSGFTGLDTPLGF